MSFTVLKAVLDETTVFHFLDQDLNFFPGANLSVWQSSEKQAAF